MIFLRNFLRYGIGRWDDILKFSNINLEVSQVRNICFGILNYFLQFQSGLSFQSLRILCSEIEFQADHTIFSEDFLQTLDGNVILKQIETIYLLGFVFVDYPDMNKAQALIIKNLLEKGYDFLDSPLHPDFFDFLPKVLEFIRTNSPTNTLIIQKLETPSDWNREEFTQFMEHILSHGSKLEPILEKFNKPKDFLQEEFNNISNKFQTISKASEIPLAVAFFIHQKIQCIDKLNQIYKEFNQHQILNLISSISKWKNFPTHWTNEKEFEFFNEIVQNGLGAVF